MCNNPTVWLTGALISNDMRACLRECGGVHEFAFRCVPLILYLTGRDLAKYAAHRNWIWAKTREGRVTSLARSGHTLLLWSSLRGGELKSGRMGLGSTCAEA